MLLNQGIRTKLLAVLALPILALMIMAGVVSKQAFQQASRAERVEELAQGSGALGDLVASLQAERSASLALLNSRPVADDLAKARARTDSALARTTKLIDSVQLQSLSPQATDAVVQSDRGHDQLDTLRLGVTKGDAQPSLVAEQYSAIINSDINLPRRIGEGLADRSIGSQLTAYSSAQRLVELATQERDAGAAVIASGTLEPATSVALSRLVALQTEAANTYRQNGTTAQNAALDTALSDPVAQRNAYRLAQQEFIGLGGKIATTSSTWRTIANDRIKALKSLTRPIAVEAGTQASEAAASARTRALAVLGGSLLVIASMVLLGSVLSRAITRPLRRLTEVAGQVRDELPLMVERMATPGEGPGITLPQIPTGSRDEVGQLARAFADVNETTVRVAEEQAALRASIAEMFVNVARRNHVLLSRQLSFIDQLERTEENPDTLENLFRLDHLATRMRRNAESLIVLAGIDAGRRLRRPMPLSDVIRTAVSEIERYDRVDLALQADPPLVGHVALTTAHLLAELLENATQFSNPDTRVIASTALTGRGVRVTVTDLGLGMTWDEISDANERIANPPMRDVVGSQRLGFFVVGRLARRLDATVELKPGRSQGTVVTIDLPPALFVPGSVVEVGGGLDEPLEADVDSKVVADAAARTAEPSTEVVAADDAPKSVVPAPFPDPGLPAPESSKSTASLPRRAGREAVPPTAAEAPAAAAPLSGASPAPGSQPARSGIFSGFRARRETSPDSAAAPAPASQLPVVEDSATTFVPVHEPAAPAPGGLPQRSEAGLPTRGARTAQTPPAQPAASEPAAPQAAASEPAASEPAASEPAASEAAAAEPTAAHQAAAEPGRVTPESREAPASVPEPTSTPQPEPAPAARVEPAPAPVTAAQPEPTTAAQPEPTTAAQAEPTTVAQAATSSEPKAAGPAPGATSALRELTSEAPPASDDRPEQPVQPDPRRGLPAMDILPAKAAGGRSWRRRSGKAPALPAPVKNQSAAAARSVSAPSGAAQGVGGPDDPSGDSEARGRQAATSPVSSVGAPSASTSGRSADASGAGADGATTGPIAAPASLFGNGASTATSAGLPTRSQAGGQAAEPQQAVPALAAAQSLRERSAMASEALSELSALSTYRPEKVQSAAPNLAKRTPQATPAGQLPPPAPEQPAAGRRPTRNAADVRSMLSGFQAGVERGRTSPAAAGPGGKDDGA